MYNITYHNTLQLKANIVCITMPIGHTKKIVDNDEHNCHNTV